MYSLKSSDGQRFIFQNSRFPFQVSTWEKRKKNSFSSKTKTCKKNRFSFQNGELNEFVFCFQNGKLKEFVFHFKKKY